MAEVVTLVTGLIQPDRVAEVTDPYREALKNGPPPDLDETFLLTGDAGQVAILSVWRRRADLDAMRRPTMVFPRLPAALGAQDFGQAVSTFTPVVTPRRAEASL